MNQETRTEPAPDAPPATSFSSSRRYLGDRPDRQGRARGRSASKLFAASSALVFLLIVLATILLSFRNQLGDRILLTAAVPVHESPLVRPLEFVAQDLEQLRSAGGIQLGLSEEGPELSNFATEEDLFRLVNEVLPVVEHDSLVVYVRMHAVSTPGGLYLLPADGDPIRPQGGLPFRRLFDAIALAPATNKLVLLDVSQADYDPTVGWFGNDIRWHLERELDLHPGVIGNLFLVCSADEGETSWSSVTVQQSVFAAVASYCLHGGADADGMGESGRRDGVLSAGEVTACLEQNVTEWSLNHRGVLQRPFHLRIGDDFPIAGVNQFLSFQTFFGDREPLAQAGTARNELRQQELSEQGASSSSGGDEPPAAPLPTTNSILARLNTAWQLRGELALTTAPHRRPRHWALYSQELQRAERLLLAGRIDDAAQVLEVSIGPLEADLATPPEGLIKYPWSLALAGAQVEEEVRQQLTAAMTAAATSPTAANLEQLAGSPFVEAALLRRLAERMVEVDADGNAAWIDPELLPALLAAQALAERAAELACPPGAAGTAVTEPCLWPVLKRDVEAADQSLLLAEQEGLLGRYESARAQVDLASMEFESVHDECRAVSEQMNRMHLTLLESTAILSWLSMTRRDDVWWIETVRILDGFLDAVVNFRRDPHRELLALLIALSNDLHRRAESVAREAVQSGDPIELRASLELPFLEPELRSEIVAMLIGRPDAPYEAGGLRRFAESSGERVAYPFSVAALYRALAVQEPPPEVLEYSNPADREFVRRSSWRIDDALRDGRLRLGDAVRQMLAELNADPLAPPPAGPSAYERYVSHLARARFQSRLLQFTRFRPVVTDELYAGMTRDLLSWQLARLERATLTTRIDVAGPWSAITRNIQEIDAAYQEAPVRSQPAFAATQISARRLPAGDRVELTYDLTSLRDIRETDPVLRRQWTRDGAAPRFVVDWYAERSRWAVRSLRTTAERANDVGGGEGTQAWRTSIPVPGLAGGGPVAVEIEVQRLGSEADAPAVSRSELTGWIELADGTRYWLPIPVELKSDVLPPFEIQLTGPGGEALPDRVDLFPNEQFPIGIGVVSVLPDAAPVTIGISSGGIEQLVDVTVESGTVGTPLAPGYSFDLPVQAGETGLRVIQDSETVAERTLAVNVLNPLSSFQTEVTFDAPTHTVKAVVRRLVRSFPDQPVPVRLELIGTRPAGGVLQAELDPSQQRVELSAVVSSDALVPHYDVSLGVCGVPRLFHYRIDAATGSVVRTRKPSIDVAAPRDGTVYAHTTDGSIRLPVHAAADFDGTCVVNIGIDRNGDDYLDADERLGSQPCWAGRFVATELVATTDPPAFVIGSRVADVTVPIAPSGMVGPQRVLAQLIAGDRILTATSDVYFLQSAPPVAFDAPGAIERIALGDPFEVVLRSDDAAYRAVETIEVGVDRNNNGAWDDDETLSSALPAEGTPLRFGATNRALDVFDSATLLSREDAESAAAPAADPAVAGGDFLPRRVVLMARTTVHTVDLARPGEEPEPMTSSVARRVIELISQADKPTPTGRISGYVVTADGLPQRDVLVSLGDLQTQSDDDGRFLLQDVPVGLQVVRASRGPREGEVEVEVIADEMTGGVEIVIAR